MNKDINEAAEKRRLEDRRKAQDPAYQGEERRKGDRRLPKPPSAA